MTVVKPLPGPTSDVDRVERLSPRRREVLELVARGMTNDDVARSLAISPTTVRTHLTSVLSQLAASNRTEAAAAFLKWAARPSQIDAVLGRPAIAVLPLQPLADDARSRTVAAGISEDLTSLFSRWSCFPVIAGVSSARGRELGSTCAEVGRALGARFLVDGALQIARSEWRLNIRIDDAADGSCLWTDRYRFKEGALFEVQDAVCDAIVATAYPVLVARAGSGRRAGTHPEHLSAWELAHDGLSLEGAREKSANLEARARFDAALRLEPTLVLAHFGLGLCAYDAILNQWEPKEGAFERLAAAAERCVQLAPHSSEGHYLLGRHFQARGEHARAIQPLEAAVALNPSFAAAHALLAQVLLLGGRSKEGLARMSQAVRLSPQAYIAGLAAAHFVGGEYELALQAAERAIASNPRYPFARVVAAVSAWHLGHRAQAAAHRSALFVLHPDFDAAGFVSTFGAKVEAVGRIGKALAAIERSSGRG